MVLIFWAVTPLQSGIFRVASTTVTQDVLIAPPARLLPPSLQVRTLGGNLNNAAYGVTWLGQTPPPFTTREFALAPFSLHSLDSTGNNASIVANTTLYRSGLSCSTPASVKALPNDVTGYLEVDDGEGCKEKTDVTNTIGSVGVNGYQSLACGKYFLVWLQDEKSTLWNTSGLITRFCKTGYYSQPVQANISVPDGRVLETWPLGLQTILSEHEINATNFEYVVSRGLARGGSGRNITTLQQKDPRPFDISEDTVLAQDYRVSQRGFPALNSILAGIAVGGQNLTFDRFIQSPEAIDAAFHSAQQLFFALAVSSMMGPSNTSETSHPAVRTFSLQSLQLVSAITRSVQACLGLITLLITALAVLYYNRFLPFRSGPNSIGFLAAVASRHNFLEVFKSMDNNKSFGQQLSYRQASLQVHDGAVSLTLDSEGSEDYVANVHGSSIPMESEATAQQEVGQRNVWPTELRPSIGLAFALALCLAAAALVFLDSWTRAHRGLPLPPVNTITQQLILNYIPTVRFSLAITVFRRSMTNATLGNWHLDRAVSCCGVPLLLLSSAFQRP